jgi:hypothetical protein
MYIVAYPVAFSIRRTDVTEESQRIGAHVLYLSCLSLSLALSHSLSLYVYVRCASAPQAMRFVMRDTVLVFASWFIVCLLEGDHLRQPLSGYTAFRVFSHPQPQILQLQTQDLLSQQLQSCSHIECNGFAQ